MDLGIPPLSIENLLESSPLKSRFLVRELTVPVAPLLSRRRIFGIRVPLATTAVFQLTIPEMTIALGRILNE